MRVSKNGYLIPETGDESSTVWQPAISDNWEKVDAHDHDGTNSSKIASVDILKKTTVIHQADWVPDGDQFSTAVALPSGYNFNNANVIFTLATSGHPDEGARLGLSVVKIDNLNCMVYSNTDEIDVEVMFV